jgi:hypothetical protein
VLVLRIRSTTGAQEPYQVCCCILYESRTAAQNGETDSAFTIISLRGGGFQQAKREMGHVLSYQELVPRVSLGK